MSPLNDEQLRRYARHTVLPEIGREGQQRLRASSALIIGAGGLGAASSAALVAAGVGRIGIVEPDRVELSNLQRQTLYETADIGQPKAFAAEARLSELNPDCKIETHVTKLDEGNAHALISDYDIVVDGTDNFAARFVLNEVCMRTKKTWIHAAMVGFDARIATFRPHEGGACYRCMVPDMPERERSCAMEGVFGPMAPVVGGLQAAETIKELLGMGTLTGQLLILNLQEMEFRKTKLVRDPACTHHL